jgi:hypothetical protein
MNSQPSGSSARIARWIRSCNSRILLCDICTGSGPARGRGRTGFLTTPGGSIKVLLVRIGSPSSSFLSVLMTLRCPREQGFHLPGSALTFSHSMNRRDFPVSRQLTPRTFNFYAKRPPAGNS